MLLALMLAGADVQSAFKDRNVGQWLVGPTEHGCSTVAIYEDKSSVYFSYDIGLNEVMLSFGDPKFKSLKRDQKYKLTVIFVTPTFRVDDGWGEADFTASIDPDGGQSLMGKFKGNMIDDLASAVAVKFMRGDVLVDAFKLTGTADTVAALRECARIRQKENPVDPFE
jgi:hypothetical protein